MQPNRARWLRLLLRLLLGVVALVLVARLTSAREVVDALRNARAGPLGLAIVCVIIDRIFMAGKWSLLLRALGLVRPVGELIRIYFVATFYGSFLPIGVAGDAIRVFHTARGRDELSRVAASIVIERVLGLISLTFIATLCLASLVLGERPDLAPLLGLISFVLAAGVATLVMVMYTRLPHRLERLVNPFRHCATQWPVLLGFLALSAVEQLIPVVANFFLGYALRLDVSFAAFLLVIPIILFLTRLPFSLDSFGVQEGLYVWLFALAGLSATNAFILSLLGRVVSVVGTLPGCFLGRARDSRAAVAATSV